MYKNDRAKQNQLRTGEKSGEGERDPCPPTTAHLSERCPVHNVPIRTPTKKIEVETGTFHALPHTKSHCVMRQEGGECIIVSMW